MFARSRIPGYSDSLYVIFAAGCYTVRFYHCHPLGDFRVETVFGFPWAVRYRALDWLGVAELTVFPAMVMVGYVWAYKKDALERV